MPLLIGPFAGMVLLLALACAPALGLAGDPDVAPQGGVLAPEGASGEPTSENPAAATAPVAPPTGAGASTPVGLAFLGVHVVWAALAGTWLWRRRLTLLTPASAHIGPTDPGVGWLLLAAAAFVWLGIFIGAGSAQLLMRIGPDEYKTLRGMVLVNAGGYVGGLLTIGFLGAMFGPLAGALGRRPRLSDAARALGAYAIAHPFIWLAGWIATQIAQALTGPHRLDPLAHDTLRALVEEPVGAWWAMAIVIAVVAAPVLEEIIYRGLLQNAFMRLTRSPGAAIGGASLVFALMHASSVSPHALPTLFGLGVAFGIAYHRTRSLGVSILMHATFNAFNLTLALLPL